MPNGWRIIDCSSLEGELSTKRGQLLVKPIDSQPKGLPWTDLAVVLVGGRVKIGASVLGKAAENDVIIMTTDWRGVPLAASYGWNDHTRVGARQIAQAKITLPRKKNAWGRVIRAKIAGQARVLSLIGQKDSSLLQELAGRVRSGDPDNLEARAAHLYWSRLFANGFSRQPRGLEDRNSMLDYGYGVLRGHCIRAVLSAGLTPALGLFHRGRSNQFNLVDDLIEPFRPVIDHAVATAPEGASLENPEVRRMLVASAAAPFDEVGYGIPKVMESLAQKFGRYVEGELQVLEVDSWIASPIEHLPSRQYLNEAREEDG